LTIAIRELGHLPLLPPGDTPRYDLAFARDDGTSLVVIEVKSLSDDHAVHQLRLGLEVVPIAVELCGGDPVISERLRA
jgi:hypothetical protein